MFYFDVWRLSQNDPDATIRIEEVDWRRANLGVALKIIRDENEQKNAPNRVNQALFSELDFARRRVAELRPCEVRTTRSPFAAVNDDDSDHI